MEIASRRRRPRKNLNLEQQIERRSACNRSVLYRLGTQTTPRGTPRNLPMVVGNSSRPPNSPCTYYFYVGPHIGGMLPCTVVLSSGQSGLCLLPLRGGLFLPARGYCLISTTTTYIRRGAGFTPNDEIDDDDDDVYLWNERACTFAT